MNKHTPGPWSCERDPCHFDTLSTVVGGDNSARKGISRQMIVDVGGWAEWREQEANARLIAAAPELLAACKAVADWWHEHEYDTVLGDDGIEISVYDSEPKMVKLARAAIAKAEGGQDE